MDIAKKYWKGIEEYQNDAGFITESEKEFTEHIPVDQFLGQDSLIDTSTNRRDFLKFLGFSVSAATLAACEAPVNKVIPYVNKPEEITPGVANWYASTYSDGKDYCSVLVKTREGRPIHIKGNDLSSVTKGAINARVQASVLSLYDTSRLKTPLKEGKPATWNSIDSEIMNKLESIAAKGGNITLLTSSMASPSTKKAIWEFTEKYNRIVKHVIYDAVSYYGMIKANKESFGKSVIPAYNFDKAKVIVSIGADFLATWLSPVEFSKQYGAARKPDNMTKHIQFETILSVTGSNADLRVPVKPSQHGAVLIGLYNEIAKVSGVASLPSTSLPVDDKIAHTAEHLIKNKGQSLVVAGSNDSNSQLIANAINRLLNNYGNTIDIDNPSLLNQSDDPAVAELIKNMKAGNVDALLMHNVNPAYTLPNAAEFTDAMSKVGLTVSFADRIDETAYLTSYVCPDSHYLESWNDANPRNGKYGLCQPAIARLFDTRQMPESLLKWAGSDSGYHEFIKKYWEENIFTMQNKNLLFEPFWNQSLHDGVFETETILTEAQPPESVEDKEADLSYAASYLNKIAGSGGALELITYEKTGVADGRHSNNPWLQELPDPVSKVCWDNYLTMNPRQMKELGFNIKQGQQEESDVVTLKANGVSVNVPVFPQPGQPYGTAGLALGYGRNRAGKAGNGVGVNAYPFTSFENGALNYCSSTAEISGSVGKYQIASTQTHHTMMGRAPVRETTFDEFRQDPKSGNPDVLVSSADHKKKKPEELNLWKDHPKEGHFWNLSIDLSACIGCGACVVGCSSENNVSVVGKDEIRRSREMHWIRIDRYYSSDMTDEKATEEGIGNISKNRNMEVPSENPEVVFQPVMCQHCNHAPCETVCPVVATTHSSDGLNQMIYNRCVGTKYCQNNCPYKVRRFNWFNYYKDDRFTDVNPGHNDLGSMVLNPDVVVRSRGVMEKCSMCIQRIQEGKLTAKREGRKIKDGEIQTACADACPTNAISFGDANVSDSKVSKLKENPRRYFLLEELDTQPSVHYLTKVRNK